MKLIQAILAPEQLEPVQRSLGEAEVFRLTVSDVQGVGGTSGPTDAGGMFALRPQVRLEIAVNDEFLDTTLAAILRGGGESGKIFVLPLSDAIRIRTKERGPEAI